MKKLFLFIFSFFTASISNAQQYNLLIGTYTNKGNSEGIYVYNFNTKTGESKLKSNIKTPNPSYLTISNDKKFVYSVNEIGKDSRVSAFSFNVLSGNLTPLNTQLTQGADPCYILADEKNVFAANYSGGSISIWSQRRRLIRQNQSIDSTSRQSRKFTRKTSKITCPSSSILAR